MPSHPLQKFFFFLLLLCFSAVNLAAQTPLEKGIDIPREKDPILRPDGKELFFTRPDFGTNKGADNAADIWVRPRYADGSWGRVLNPGSPINSFAHDRALAFSPDGNRLAVLRTGASDFIDLLEVSGRNWRILESWPIPRDAAPRYDLTFDPNAQRLIYSAYGAGGSLDLFSRDALPYGKWGAAKELSLLNGAGNETAPSLASDGRTLYFRRGNKWFRQDDLHLGAVQVNIPDEVRQFSQLPTGTAPYAEAIIVSRQTGQKEQLLSMALPVDARQRPSSLTRGYLTSPPLPGEQTATVATESGMAFRVRPDALQRYTVFLREGERLIGDGNLPPVSGIGSSNSLAATSDFNESSSDQKQLEVGIARRERELQRLDAERRRYDKSLVQTDEELLDLRDKYERSLLPAGDTLPPARTAKSRSTRDRYAEELAELERKKAKFRQQQDDKIRQRSYGGKDHRWEAPTRTSNSTPAPATRVPSIEEAYKPPTSIDPRMQREQAYRDSLRLRSTVRSGLYSDQRPASYEKEAWENELQRDLPRTTPLSPEEAARLDAEYQRKIDEIASLRAELQRLNNNPTNTSNQPQSRQPASNRNWSAKGNPTPAYGTPAQQAPVNYNEPYRTPQPAAPATYGQTSAAIPAGISFIPNTAYPDGAGYGGLDQLVRQVQTSATILEIRIHTPVDMDRRAAQLLSEERATTIKNYLTEKGISPRNYKVIGFGNNLTGAGGERVEVVR